MLVFASMVAEQLLNEPGFITSFASQFSSVCPALPATFVLFDGHRPLPGMEATTCPTYLPTAGARSTWVAPQAEPAFVTVVPKVS
jgi:hypothetical protein